MALPDLEELKKAPEGGLPDLASLADQPMDYVDQPTEAVGVGGTGQKTDEGPSNWTGAIVRGLTSPRTIGMSAPGVPMATMWPDGKYVFSREPTPYQRGATALREHFKDAVEAPSRGLFPSVAENVASILPDLPAYALGGRAAGALLPEATPALVRAAATGAGAFAVPEAARGTSPKAILHEALMGAGFGVAGLGGSALLDSAAEKIGLEGIARSAAGAAGSSAAGGVAMTAAGALANQKAPSGEDILGDQIFSAILHIPDVAAKVADLATERVRTKAVPLVVQSPINESARAVAMSSHSDIKRPSGPDYSAEGPGQFHGTSQAFDRLGPVYSPSNLFGPGFYVTDNVSRAASYTMKGRGSDPAVYRVRWIGPEPPRVLDLEQPLPLDAVAVFERQRQWNDYIPEQLTGRPAKDVYQEMRSNMEDEFTTEHEAWDNMEPLNINLREIGYDAMSHVGGGLANKSDATRHHVTIYLDPELNADKLSLERVKPMEREAESGKVPIAVATLGIAPFVDQDVIPAGVSVAKGTAEALRNVRNIVAPKLGVSPEAQDAVYRYMGGLERSKFMLDATLGGARKMFSRMTLPDQIAFTDRRMQGQEQPTPELQSLADAMRAIDTAKWKEANALPIHPSWLENHVNIQWAVPPGSSRIKEIVGAFTGGRNLMGSKGMLRHKSYMTLSEGLRDGGVPRFTNPIEAFQASQADMDKLIYSQKLIQWAKENGALKWVPNRQMSQAPDGFRPIDDKAFRGYMPDASGKKEPGRFLVEDGFGRMLESWLSRDFIRETALGRGIMEVKNQMTSVVLGWSGFHLGFVSAADYADTFGRNVRFLNTRSVQGAKLAASDNAAGILGPLLHFAEGRQAKRFYGKPEELATPAGRRFLNKFPDAKRYMDELFEGAAPKLVRDERYIMQAAKSARDALKSGNPIGALIRSPFAVNDLAFGWIQRNFVPNLKVGVYLRERSLAELEQAHDLATGQTTGPRLSRHVWEFTEDKYGLKNWDTLFLHRTMKTALQIAFRSFTWWYGSLSGGAGAPIEQGAELMRAIKEKRVPRITQRMGWIAGTAGTAALMGIVASKMLSGKYPWEWDGSVVNNTMFPHGDPNDPDLRISTPNYLRVLYGFGKHPLDAIKNAQSDFTGKLVDLYQNRDFHHTQIYDPHGNIGRVSLQMMEHMLPQPIALQSWVAESDAKNEPVSQVTPLKAIGFMGFTKASAANSQTPAEQTAYELSSETRSESTPLAAAEKAKNRKLAVMQAMGGNPALARKMIANQELTPGRVAQMEKRHKEPPLVRAVSAPGFTAEDALTVWQKADPIERQQIRQLVGQKILNRIKARTATPELLAAAKASGIFGQPQQ